MNMKVGVSVQVSIINPDYLKDGAEDITGKRQSESLSLAALFRNSQTSGSFKILAIDVEGAGRQRTLNIVANVLDEKGLLEDATEAFRISGGDKVSTITSHSLAVYELAVASNSNESPDQLGIYIGDATELSNSDIRRVLERVSESSKGL
jgi:hypothetical protein